MAADTQWRAQSTAPEPEEGCTHRSSNAAAEQDQISHERACRQHQGRLSDKLPELERLANYEHRFMRQIQRNTDLLNELQCRRRNRDLIPGSFSENIFSRG